MRTASNAIVAIETSALRGSVAVGRGGEVIEEKRFSGGLRHGRELVLAIDELVERNSLAKSDIGVVAVTLGPGSYTGTRVGVTAAKCVAQFLGADVVGVSSLEVIVRNLDPADRPAAVVLDARRGMVYAAVFDPAGGRWTRQTDDSIVRPERLGDLAPPEAIVVGDAYKRYEALLDQWECLKDPETGRPKASELLKLAWARWQKGETVDPLELAPVYLRRSEAEEKRARDSM
jgi:tRNA threonylcarbamoyladenosine biosynthesis protein TsaB